MPEYDFRDRAKPKPPGSSSDAPLPKRVGERVGKPALSGAGDFDWVETIGLSQPQLAPAAHLIGEYLPVAKAMLESILESEAAGPDVFGEWWDDVKESWPAFIATLLGMAGAELLANAMIASGNPAIQIAGIILQAVVLAFAVAAVAVEFSAVIDLSKQWIALCTQATIADHDANIQGAARVFAQIVFKIIKTIATYLGAKMLHGAIGKLARPKQRALPEPHDTARSARTSEPESVPAKARDVVAVTGRGLPEFAVPRRSVEIEPIHQSTHFALSFDVPANGRSVHLGSAYVQTVDGMPIDLPDLGIGADIRVDGQDHVIAIYDEVSITSESPVPVGKGQRIPLTKFALEHFEAAYEEHLGMKPGGYHGRLIDSTRLNFQREYVIALDRGLTDQAARVEAIKRISFGKHRVPLGYTEFTVTFDDWAPVDLGSELGIRKAPINIEVIARRP